MKIILAPDSFKGSLCAREAAQLLRAAALRHFPAAQTVMLPIADGGEGTVEALMGVLGGRMERALVSGPLGAPVEAHFGLPEPDLAVLEMASASGLTLIPSQARDPMRASSRGTGELLLAAWARGARRFLLGIGGSATNDGGTGMLRALGARFLDEAGREVPEGGAGLAAIARIDLAGLHPLARQAQITVMCDVNNPLLGAQGASHVYGPQKGADAAMCAQLDAGMARFAAAAAIALGREIADFPGAGAAGGLGAALAGFLEAELVPGVEAVLRFARFDELLADAHLCVTGEGRLDGQSVRYGKVVAGLAKACAARGVKLIVLAGGMEKDARALYEIADAAIMVTAPGPIALEEAMRDARALFADAADRLFRLLRMGASLGQAGPEAKGIASSEDCAHCV